MKFLHLEDNPVDAALVHELLSHEWPDCHIDLVSNRPEFLQQLERDGHDLILSDFTLVSFTGLEALEIARARVPDTPFVFFTGTLGEDRAIDTVHHGASDYVLKDHMKRLPTAIRRALREAAERRQRQQMEAANHRLLDIFANTPDLVAMTSPSGQVLYLNRAGRRLLGLADAADLSQASIREFHPPEVADFILHRAVPEAIRDNTWTGETVVLARDGRQVPVSQVLIAHKNSNGTVSYLSTIMRDLTAQRRHEAAVRESNERFELVARATNDTIWDWNLLTNELWWSASYQTLFGHPRPAQGGDISTWTRHIHPEDLKRVKDSINRAIEEGPQDWMDEYRFQRADGTYADILDRGHVMHDPTGKPHRMIGSMLDITERKRAERRVRELIELLDKAPDAIVVSELDGCVTFWNRGAERLSGWSSADAMGRRIEELFGPEAREKIAGARHILDEKGEWRGELHLHNREGNPVIVEFSASVIRDDHGRPRARLSIVTDITERKALEERFLRAQRLESVGMLASGIAHDLNNVLAPILMGAPMLRDHITDPGDLELLAMFEKSAERGAGLVRQILSFAHGVGGEPRQVQVKHLLRDLGSVIVETFPKNIRFESYISANLFPITANPTQIHQVLLNLCVNARDAMPTGGALSLRAENVVLDELGVRAIEGSRPGPWLMMQVEDTGTGIKPEVLARIWEPFFTTKEAGKGTGLGLSTVRGIVETHRGFLSVQSELGKGTMFRVYLPASEGALGEPTLPASLAIPRGNGQLILVVDDEINIRNVTTTTLSRHGYRVIAARDGTEALALFAPRSREISLMVTDMNMPRLDGAAIASVVRRLNPEVRILAASGLGSGEKSEAGAHVFADAFLSKPFNVETLLRAVHDLLQLPKRSPETGKPR
jgi:two-component system cell cycle sensor histidine kinase/response regulator CckA